MSPNPTKSPIKLENGVIEAVNEKDGYSFIGFKLTYTDDIYKLIKNNLNSKMFNVAQFYAWLEYNESTPFFIKFKVLYACLFSSLLYSSEAWGKLSKIECELLTIERKALKSCLGVKSGTTNDIIYTEINKPDIIASIKDRQHKFGTRIMQLKPGEALVKEIWNICVDHRRSCENLRNYYEKLNGNECHKNINERRQRINTSDQTMCIRYRQLIGLNYCSTLYTTCLDDTKRTIITRWRLSSHKLKIEKGRYTKPITKEEDRLCKICDVREDEIHAIYSCKAHRLIRDKYRNILNLQADFSDLMNPRSTAEAIHLATFLLEIEENMEYLDMT